MTWRSLVCILAVCWVKQHQVKALHLPEESRFISLIWSPAQKMCFLSFHRAGVLHQSSHNSYFLLKGSIYFAHVHRSDNKHILAIYIYMHQNVYTFHLFRAPVVLNSPMSLLSFLCSHFCNPLFITCILKAYVFLIILFPIAQCRNNFKEAMIYQK